MKKVYVMARIHKPVMKRLRKFEKEEKLDENVSKTIEVLLDRAEESS